MANTTDNVTLSIDVKLTDAKKRLEQLEGEFKKLQQLREKFQAEGDNKGLRQTQKAMESTRREMEQLTLSSKAWGKALGDLSGENEKSLRRIRKELTALLNSQDVERGSAEWDKYTEALQRVDGELRKIRQERTAATEGLADWGAKWQGFAITARAALDTVSAAISEVGGLVEKYADFQQHTAAVTKYTGLAKEQVAELNAEFRKMDTATTPEKLNDLAADAGRLGLQAKDDILSFVQAADQLNLALGDDLGEDAVKNIGKLADIFGDSDRMGLKQAMLSTGSAINELAQSSSASEGYILEFTNRLAGVAKQAGLTQAQVMGFASVMDQSGVGVERGATALQNTISALFKDPAKMAKAAGLEVQSFANLLKTDANQAITQFLAALQQKGGFDALAPVLAEMGMSGSGVTQTLSTLSSRLADVKDAQDLANKAFTEGTSCTNEAAVANSTAAAQLQKAQNRARLLAVTLGEELFPLYVKATEAAVGFSDKLIIVAKWAGQNKTALLLLSASLLSLAAAQAYATVTAKAHALATAAAAAVQKTWTAAVLLAHAAAAALSGNLTKARAAMAAFNAVCRANPWLLLASALLAVGAAVVALARRTPTLTAAQKAAAAAAEANAAAQSAVSRAGDKAAEDAARQGSEVKRLTSILHDNNQLLATRQQALARLRQIVPGYTADLTAEGKLYNENTAALNKYVEGLQAAARARAYASEMEDSAKRQAQAERTADRKQNNVNKSRAALAKLEAARPAGGQAQGTAGADLVSLSYDETLEKKREEVRKNEEALAKARQEIANEQRTQEELKARISKDTAAAAQVVAQSGGGTPGTSGGGTPAKSGAAKKTTDLTALQKEADKARAALAAEYAAQTLQAAEGATEWETYRRRLYEIDEDYYAKALAKAKGDKDTTSRLEKEKAAAVQARREETAEWSLQDIDRAAREEEAAAKAAYDKGELSAEQHQEALSRIQLQAQAKRVRYLRDHGANSQKEAETLHAEEQKLEEKQAADRQLREENLQKQIAEAKSKYLRQSAAQRYEQEMQWLAALEKAELAAAVASEEAKLEIQKRYAAMRQALAESYATKGASSGASLTPAATEYVEKARAAAGGRSEQVKDGGAFSGVARAGLQVSEANAASAALADLYAADTAALQAQLSAKQISEEEYNRRSLEMQQAHAAAAQELTAAQWQSYQTCAQEAMSAVNSVLSSATSFVSAQASLQEAKVTARYGAEIEAAGKNSAEGQRLEEEKQKALNAIKKKASKKQAKIEIAQAVLDTAINAIKAYQSMASIPVVGPALGAVAAAAAVAFGAVQIATIKKQHAAQEAAYYSGGYTGGTQYRKEAGVVHEGEFVANHLAVQNPAVRPVLDLIDQAQRTGKVAALTPEAIAAAAGASPAGAQGADTSAPADAATAAALARSAAATDRLAAVLEKGIRATASIDGSDGVAEQLRRYNNLTGA